MALGLSLNKDNAASIHGDISFDEAHFHASIPALQFEFDKPGKEPLKIMLEGCASTRGVLPTSIAKLNVSGKFGEFEARNFFTAPYGSGPQFSVENFAIKSSGLACAGSVANFDLKGDKLEARLESPSLELRGLPELWQLAQQNSHGAGKLTNVTFGYKGGLVALMAGLPPKLRPKFDEEDPRRAGVQPGVDQFELEGDLDGVRVDATKENGIELGGRVRIAAGEMACKNFTAEIRGWYPAEGANVAVQKALHVQKFSIPKLYIKSSNPNLNLRQALAAAGLPLEISGDVECEKPITEDQLSVLKSALKAVASESMANKEASGLEWPAVSKLFVNASLKAPGLLLANYEAGNFEARNTIFRDLKFSVPVLTTSFLGGRLKLEDAEYDFSRMAAKSSVGGPSKGLRHTQRISFTDGDLCKLLGGEKPEPVRYAVCGKVGAQGPFGGMDFGATDRLSWSGALKCDFSNFSVSSPIVPSDNAIAPLPWMEFFKHHAAGRGMLLARASSTESVSPLELSINGATTNSNASNVFDGFLASAELYFAKVYGVESVRMEFEPFMPTVRIDKGLADFEPFELKGKGACAGFDIQVRNLKINLADESFADEAVIYPMTLPKDAQDRIALNKWPALTRQLFLTSMGAGRMPLRISGALANPTIKFPWAEASAMARTALFGVDAITDADALAKAREHLLRVWGKDDASLEAAAMLADRFSAGLPGTLTSRLTRETIVDHATKLPPKVMEAAEQTAAARATKPLLKPLESLKIILFAEPEPPVVVPPTSPEGPGVPPTITGAPAGAVQPVAPGAQTKPDASSPPVRNGKP